MTVKIKIKCKTCNNEEFNKTGYCLACLKRRKDNKINIMKALDDYFQRFWPETDYYNNIPWNLVECSSSNNRKTITGLNRLLVARCSKDYVDKESITVDKVNKAVEKLKEYCDKKNKLWYDAFLIKTNNYLIEVPFYAVDDVKKLQGIELIERTYLGCQMFEIKVSGLRCSKEKRLSVCGRCEQENKSIDNPVCVGCKFFHLADYCYNTRKIRDRHYCKALEFIAKNLNLLKAD